MPAWAFGFYCLTVKIGTLGERPLLAQTGRSWIFAPLHRSASLCVFDRASGTPPAANRRRTDMTVSAERAVLAGRCFWGVQDLLRRYPRVISTRVAYPARQEPRR